MIHRSLTTALIALLTTLAAGAASAEELAGIRVTGVGEVKVVPDMARLTLEARREGTDAAALKSELDEVAAAVLELADELGIGERDVTAAAVGIYPRYRRSGDDQEPDGVIASRTIEVTLRDLTLMGELINGALERGANGVQGVDLDASNRTELERRALDRAIDDAVDEASRMARRFEVTLGPLKDASSSGHQAQPLRMEAMSMRAMAKDESFAPGELTIRREVHAVFGIRP